MNTFVRAAMSAGAGGLFAVGMHASMDATLLNTAETNTHAEKCAAALGETAMYSAVLPEPCKEFELSLESTTVKVKVTNLEGSRVGTKESVEYILPSADEFRREFGPTESTAEVNERIGRMNRVVSRGLGALLAVSLFLLPHTSRLNRRDSHELPASRRESYQT